MTTLLKYLTILGLTIAALTSPLLQVSATEVEDEYEATEDIDAREAYRRLQLQDENGQIPPDAWINAYAEKERMPFLPEAWSEFSTAAQREAGIVGGSWTSIWTRQHRRQNSLDYHKAWRHSKHEDHMGWRGLRRRLEIHQ